jgi:two-component system response regulator FixJ
MPDSNTVHVIDDDDAVRQSLEFLLKSADFPVRTYPSATAFVKALPEIRTGCIITDVRMPDLGGIELLRQLREHECTVPVIVMTGHGDVALAVEAMKAGAMDFLEKPFDDEHMIETVRAALDLGKVEAQRTSERAAIQQKLDSLSHRERQVLEGLVKGLPNKIIAYDLGISPRTVEIYRANVMTKMAANSLSQLVRMALAAGILIDTPEPKKT